MISSGYINLESQFIIEGVPDNVAKNSFSASEDNHVGNVKLNA